MKNMEKLTIIYNGSKEVSVYQSSHQFNKMILAIKERYKYIAGGCIQSTIRQVRILGKK